MSETTSPCHDDLFLNARTYQGFLDGPVDEATLRKLYDLLKMAPTSANSQPGRFVFVQSAEAKEKLRPALAAGNVDKTMKAPVTVIVAYDLEFHAHMPRVFPAVPAMQGMLAGMPEPARDFYLTQNTGLQAGYLILAARALGLGCGPMGGFHRATVDAAFFADRPWKSVLLVNLGYGDPAQVYPRNDRLDFAEACQFA